MIHGFTFVDLFSGVGGFHGALAPLGGKAVYAIEQDRHAAAVYERNWGIPAHGDIWDAITDVRVDVPSHNVLTAGFPCQPFSKSGEQRGMDEARGTLFWAIARVIEEMQPEVVFLENVRNLVGPRHRHEWSVILETLRQLGYRVSDTPTIFSPHWLPPDLGGSPQVRERVFICATRADDRASLEAEPVLEHGPVGGWNPHEWDVIRDLPMDASEPVSRYALSEQETRWLKAWDSFVEHFRRHRPSEKLPSFPIWSDSFTTLSELSIPDGTPPWKATFLRKNAALFTEHETWISDWIDAWGIRSDRFPPSRRKLEWQAGTIRSLWETALHFRPSGIRARPPTYLPALVAIAQTSVIGPLRRRITPREAARLQGFRDDFEFGGQPDASTYRQLGNAVHIGATRYVFYRHILRDIDILTHSAPGLVAAALEAASSFYAKLGGATVPRRLLERPDSEVQVKR